MSETKLDIVVGIDPGLRATGFAVLELSRDTLHLLESGEIKPPVRQPLPDRLGMIFSQLEAVLKRWQPRAMALEKVYSAALFPNTAIIMGHVRGVICLAAQRVGAEVIEFPSTELKKALTGFGRASKEQMAQAITRLLGLKEIPDSEHISDALALAAVCALRTEAKDRGKEA